MLGNICEKYVLGVIALKMTGLEACQMSATRRDIFLFRAILLSLNNRPMVKT